MMVDTMASLPGMRMVTSEADTCQVSVDAVLERLARLELDELAALIWAVSPVLEFLPSLAARSLMAKVPKPVRARLSPVARVSAMAVRETSRTAALSFLARPVFYTMVATRSVLVMGVSLD